MSTSREVWRPEQVSILRSLLGDDLAGTDDAHLEDLYEEFSGDVYAAGWMAPSQRTVEIFLAWLRPPNARG